MEGNHDEALKDDLSAIRSPDGKIYFVVKSKKSNLETVKELKVYYKTEKKRWSWSVRDVYSSTTPIKVMQFVKDDRQG